MADLALLVNSTDTALLAENAVSPVAPASSGQAEGSSFAGMLGERLGQAQEKQSITTTSTPPVDESTGQPLGQTGESTPANGKPLPILAEENGSPLDVEADVVADAAMLAAILQASPELTNRARPVGAVAGLSTPTNEGGPLTNFSAGLPGRTAEQGGLPMQTTGTAVSLVTTPSTDTATQLERVGEQKNMADLLQRQIARDNNRQDSSAISPAALGKPISEAAQLALARAMTGVKPEGQSNPILNRETGLSLGLKKPAGGVQQVATSMNTALRMNIFTGAMASAAQGTQKAEFQAAMQSIQTQVTAPALPVNQGGTAGDTGMVVSGVQPLSPAPTNAFSAPALTVATPVGHPGWASEMGQRVTWLANSEIREAQLQLHPRSLGSVEVRIAFGHDQQLNVSFTAANPVAREALDSTLPRLREMFEQQGLSLGDANISHESFAEQDRREKMEYDPLVSGGLSSESGSSELVQAAVSASVARGEGMLDAYA